MVQFYKKHNITTDHHRNDSKRHIMIREKLYRTLGLPPVQFYKKEILDIGPGRGYNALANFHWGASVHFVEPNPQAQRGLEKLMEEKTISKKRWRLFKQKIEDFTPFQKYDLVFAEGFLPGIYNRKAIIKKITQLVNVGGIVVVTCMDDLSFFLELLKRILAIRLMYIKTPKTFEEKLKLLSRAFSSHLKTLKHATRTVKDWIVDTFLCPSIYADLFSIEECLKDFGNNFMLYGSSPSIFTDYSWYKDLSYTHRKSIIEQFHSKRHMFMLNGMKESLRDPKDNQELASMAFDLRKLCEKFEKEQNHAILKKIIKTLKNIRLHTSQIDERISEAIEECICLLRDLDLNALKISSCKIKHLFGKGVQYVSLVKQDIYHC